MTSFQPSRHRVLLGTRGSPLALRQADLILDRLRVSFPMTEFETRIIHTTGDRHQDQPISSLGDKGVFVRGIEEALKAGEIDAAVHSLKDVPGDVEQPGLVLAAYSSREDPRDVLVSSGDTLARLSPGSRIGTGSLRRITQLRVTFPSLCAVPIRGNVETRLARVDAGEYDAVILAAAGLHRLDLQHRITEYLDPEIFVPDAGQGIIAVQARNGEHVARMLADIDDSASRRCATAERAVARALGADCNSPVGALARLKGERLLVVAVATRSVDAPVHRGVIEGPGSEAAALGSELGSRLRALILKGG
jgi:hydroxymethylbilane synthase